MQAGGDQQPGSWIRFTSRCPARGSVAEGGGWVCSDWREPKKLNAEGAEDAENAERDLKGIRGPECLLVASLPRPA